jgi:hypothetical protein
MAVVANTAWEWAIARGVRVSRCEAAAAGTAQGSAPVRPQLISPPGG